MAPRGLLQCAPMIPLACPVLQVSLSSAGCLGKEVYQNHPPCSTARHSKRNAVIRAVLKTCLRCNNLLRGSISVVNCPCDKNSSLIVSLKSRLRLSNLCPLHPVLFSAARDSRLFPPSLQYPARHVNNFVLFLQYFLDQTTSLFLSFLGICL